MDTLRETLERILEIMQIKRNLASAVTNGEITQRQADEIFEDMINA